MKQLTEEEAALMLRVRGGEVLRPAEMTPGDRDLWKRLAVRGLLSYNGYEGLNGVKLREDGLDALASFEHELEQKAEDMAAQNAREDQKEISQARERVKQRRHDWLLLLAGAAIDRLLVFFFDHLDEIKAFILRLVGR